MIGSVKRECLNHFIIFGEHHCAISSTSPRATFFGTQHHDSLRKVIAAKQSYMFPNLSRSVANESNPP